MDGSCVCELDEGSCVCGGCRWGLGEGGVEERLQAEVGWRGKAGEVRGRCRRRIGEQVKVGSEEPPVFADRSRGGLNARRRLQKIENLHGQFACCGWFSLQKTLVQGICRSLLVGGGRDDIAALPRNEGDWRLDALALLWIIDD